MFSLSYVSLFASLFVACAGNPTYLKPSRDLTDLSSSLERRAGSPATENIVELGGYKVAEVMVDGTADKLRLIIDTASCWTWVKRESIQAAPGRLIGDFEARYMTGNTKGQLYASKVTVGGKLVIEQDIGVAFEYDDEARGEEWDGILGLGTKATCAQRNAPATVLENLQKAGVNNILDLFFNPQQYAEGPGGQVIWGGADGKQLSTVPMLKDADHWSVKTTVGYQNDAAEGPVAACLDSASTHIFLPPKTYNMFIQQIGAEQDGDMTVISSENYAKMGNLDIEIGGRSYPLPPSALVEQEWDGPDIGLKVVEGDMLLGIPFFERYYVRVDADKNQVGLATTRYSLANTYNA